MTRPEPTTLSVNSTRVVALGSAPRGAGRNCAALVASLAEMTGPIYTARVGWGWPSGRGAAIGKPFRKKTRNFVEGLPWLSVAKQRN